MLSGLARKRRRSLELGFETRRVESQIQSKNAANDAQNVRRLSVRLYTNSMRRGVIMAVHGTAMAWCLV